MLKKRKEKKEERRYIICLYISRSPHKISALSRALIDRNYVLLKKKK